MGLTVDNTKIISLGSRRKLIADVDFDSSYAWGGESFDYLTKGFTRVDTVRLESKNGVSFEYDYTNKKIKAFVPAPPIVFEEVVTVTSNVGYLKYPAAHIEYISDGADPFMVIPGGLTPVAKSCAVDMGFNLTTGVLTKGQRCSLTFKATDSVTKVYVSYITQAWKEVTDNMVQACMTSGVRTYGHANLAFTAGTPDIVALGEDFVALQSVCWNDAGTIKPMSPLKDDAGVTNGRTEVVADFRKATTFGELAFHQTDAVDTSGDVVYVNYIRDPGSGFLYDRFTNADIDDSSDTITFTGFPLIGCTCGSLPMETSNKKAKFTSTGTTLAANEAKFTSHPFLPGTTMAIVPVVTMHADTDDDTAPAWISGFPWEIQAVPLEAPNGMDLSNITNAKMEVIGY